jgi:putative ABC transport system substrate-binding protein
VAQKLGVALPVVEATTAEQLDIAFASAVAQHGDAIADLGDALTFNNAARVTALAAKHRLPAHYLFRLFVTNGGLISYGPDIGDLFFVQPVTSIRLSKVQSPLICRLSSRPNSSW